MFSNIASLVNALGENVLKFNMYFFLRNWCMDMELKNT